MIDLFRRHTHELDAIRFMAALEALEREIPEHPKPPANIAPQVLAKLRERVAATITRLASLNRTIDPVQQYEVYDPSHPLAAADLIAERLLRQPRVPLAKLSRFYGAGVYALYYVGPHPAYHLISGTDIPIYVGKAEAADSHAHNSVEQGEKLYDRLAKDHAKSIRAAETYAAGVGAEVLAATGVYPLQLLDFECRFLVLASAYAGAVERNLINHLQPVWNKEVKVCIGFGKHGDDAKRRANTRSEWDTIHPGRRWAMTQDNVPNPRTPEQIQGRIIAHCKHAYHSPGMPSSASAVEQGAR